MLQTIRDAAALGSTKRMRANALSADLENRNAAEVKTRDNPKHGPRCDTTEYQCPDPNWHTEGAA